LGKRGGGDKKRKDFRTIPWWLVTPLRVKVERKRKARQQEEKGRTTNDEGTRKAKSVGATTQFPGGRKTKDVRLKTSRRDSPSERYSFQKKKSSI